MKYCYGCGRVTPGTPLYCGHCARTYDVKLCPRHHPNPRSFEACSQCGSKDLSTPQPKVKFRWKVLEFLTRVAMGTILAALTLGFLVAAAKELLTRPEVQMGLVGLGILLGILWWLWSLLPEWFRKFVYRTLQKKKR